MRKREMQGKNNKKKGEKKRGRKAEENDQSLPP